ncbi:MAG TPA: hypothetical protein VE442_02645 [Jatrophihabitans sp.]|nr:hypothetical protein [Jatrophihabitans sp.]
MPVAPSLPGLLTLAVNLMSRFEEQVSRLHDQIRARRRWAVPALAAAGVAVVAVVGSLVVFGGSPSPKERPPAGSTDALPTAQSKHPQRDATRTARTLIANATVLPGARPVGRKPVAALEAGQAVAGPKNKTVWRHAFWTAPGKVMAALDYLKAHAPDGMKQRGSSTSRGGAGPTVHGLAFGETTWRPYNVHWWVNFSVTPFHSGVAVAAYAEVIWAPYRSRHDLVPSSVTSVNVTVVTPLHQGEPALHKKLTGGAARALAGAVNQLPRTNPVGPIPCPLGENLSDTLVFRSSGPTAQVKVDLAGCASSTFRLGHRQPIQLADPTGLHNTIMTALGLPKNYGRPG